MATTVTYEGNTIATVENTTKTLQTKGTWLTDDITLTDTTAGGGEWTTDGLATNTEPNGNITLGNSVTAITEYAFYKRPITGISGANVVTVGQYACAYTNVAACSFPNATTIGTQAFRDAPLVDEIYPNVTKISAEAFRGTLITEVTDTQFPALVTLDGAVFGNAKYITKVFLSLPRSTGSYSFDACDLIETAVFPVVHTTGSGTFRNCPKLKAADFRGNHTAATRINDRTFMNDAIFDTLIYGGNRLPILDLNAFNGTPFASGGTGGTLYVRQDMIANFQSATNWATILSYPNNQILAIEGSYYETHYADGTVIV